MDDFGFHGLELAVRRLSGAAAVRIVHPQGQAIEPHRHELPFLMMPVLGGCQEQSEAGEADVAGPAAVIHPPGGRHADVIGQAGLETFTIEFEPGWVRRYGFAGRLDRSRYCLGGPVAAQAARLKAIWSDETAGEDAVGEALAAFLTIAETHDEPTPRPGWLSQAKAMLADEETPSTTAMARRLDLNPAWLARAYRAAAGEGLSETLQRRRVERASTLLRGGERPLAEIALDAGFCDQSHMNRVFRRLIGRTPVQVRAEGALLSALA